MLKQRRALIDLVGEAFRESDFDEGGTLEGEELEDLLAKCRNFHDMLEYVGLTYEKMERACNVADYDHSGRSYWHCTDQRGNTKLSVHHDKHRPPPRDPHSTKVTCDAEGVLEAELVACLTTMDDPQTRGDYFAVMKRIRLAEKRLAEEVASVNQRLDRHVWWSEAAFKEIMRLSGGSADWEPPTPPPSLPTATQHHSAAQNFMPAKALEDATEAELQSPSGAATAQLFAANTDQQTNPIGLLMQGAAFNLPAGATLKSVIELLFDRYDMDGSGTISTVDEFYQLITNFVYKYKPPASMKEIILRRLENIEHRERIAADIELWLEQCHQQLLDEEQSSIGGK